MSALLVVDDERYLYTCKHTFSSGKIQNWLWMIEKQVQVYFNHKFIQRSAINLLFAVKSEILQVALLLESSSAITGFADFSPSKQSVVSAIQHIVGPSVTVYSPQAMK